MSDVHIEEALVWSETQDEVDDLLQRGGDLRIRHCQHEGGWVLSGWVAGHHQPTLHSAGQGPALLIQPVHDLQSTPVAMMLQDMQLRNLVPPR